MNDWEIREAATLMEVLEAMKINTAVEDHRVWRGYKSGVFSVSSFYFML